MGHDYECSWWPDEWFGVSINHCCVAHDLGGSDLELFQCVAEQGPYFWVLGVVMIVGLMIGRPLYHAVTIAKQKRKADS